MVASRTSSAAVEARSPPNKWRVAHTPTLQRRQLGPVETSYSANTRARARATSGITSPLETQFAQAGHRAPDTTGNEEQVGSKPEEGVRREDFLGSSGPARHTHLIIDHTRDTIAAGLPAQGQSARPPLPVAKRPRPLGSVVSLVGRKGLRESEARYHSEMPEVWVPPQKCAEKRSYGPGRRKAVWEMYSALPCEAPDDLPSRQGSWEM